MWRLPVKQARFHRDGTFFMPPTLFPVALCDVGGYVLFRTVQDYRSNPKLSKQGPRVNLPGGVPSLPEYVRADDPVRQR